MEDVACRANGVRTGTRMIEGGRSRRDEGVNRAATNSRNARRRSVRARPVSDRPARVRGSRCIPHRTTDASRLHEPRFVGMVPPRAMDLRPRTGGGRFDSERGCAASGTTAAKPSATSLPNIVPSPTGPPTLGDVRLSPSPGTDASLVENLKYDLRVETIKMAYAMGKTSATCNKKHLQVEPGATVKCTVPTRCPRPLERPDQGPGHNARSGRVHR